MSRLIRASSGDAVYVSVVLTETSGQDLTAASFQMGLSPTWGEPPDAWHSPDISEAVATGKQRLKLLVGPGGYNPAPAKYQVWLRVSDAPEIESVSYSGDGIVIE